MFTDFYLKPYRPFNLQFSFFLDRLLIVITMVTRPVWIFLINYFFKPAAYSKKRNDCYKLIIMKKVLVLMTAFLLSLGVMAQNSKRHHHKMHSKTGVHMQDCCMMKDGKMMMMKNGKMMTMDKDMTMSNGTMCMMDGTCKMKNGKSVMMKDGDKMYMNGKMGKMKMDKMDNDKMDKDKMDK